MKLNLFGLPVLSVFIFLFLSAQLLLDLHGLFNVSYYEMLVMAGITILGICGNLSYTFAVK